VTKAQGLKLEVSGYTEAFEDIEILARVLQDRSGMHARMAMDSKQFTSDYLMQTPRHKTADRLGASPTGFRARNAQALQATSDSTQAILRIPRRTGLGRAFQDIVIVPGAGRTYLTIPGDARTYGKVVRDFPEGTFKFAILYAHRPFPVLLFVSDGKVAYWLRRRVLQKQDRTLLPSDDAMREVARRSAVSYLTSAVYRAA
jgi:hypothetical protein